MPLLFYDSFASCRRVVIVLSVELVMTWLLVTDDYATCTNAASGHERAYLRTLL